MESRTLFLAQSRLHAATLDLGSLHSPTVPGRRTSQPLLGLPVTQSASRTGARSTHPPRKRWYWIGGESLKVWRLEQPWPSMAVVVHWRFGCAVLCVAGTTSHLRESLLRYGVKYVQLSMECLVINYCL